MSYEPSFWDEPDKLEFTAIVENVDGKKVVLSETYFHPEGGGQPADKGTLDSMVVVDVQKEEGEIVHHVEDHQFSKGDEVEGKIDPEFRRYCMRAHTGSHIVYGAARRVLGEVDYSGFEIGDESCRIDFETETHVDRDKLLALEKKANEAVLKALPTETYLVNRDELEDIDDLAFAKELPDEEEVRVVDIDGLDRSTCSGTHLSNTIEVGRINVLGKKKLQEGVTRVEFCTGEKALVEDYKEKGWLLGASEMLETAPSGLVGKISGFMDELEDCREKAGELREELLKRSIAGMREESIGEYTLKIGTLETDDTETLSRSVKDSCRDNEIISVVKKGERPSVFVCVGQKIEGVDAGEIISKISDEYGGGGGGTKRFAQGGGFDSEEVGLERFVSSLIEKMIISE